MSHGVHRGILKKGKFDKREKFIDKLISRTPNIKFDLYGLKNIQPIWADDFKKALTESKMGLNLSQGSPKNIILVIELHSLLVMVCSH